ncbi:hypothetical protein DAI21_17885 [Lelliottia sp. WB101]|uniref:hypothetical protein n=1 Tax=Lelliottia sp. WB101 TaxID=2153385 RepID=UPI000D215CED|nr:hypothetical protein [Lelliottia sp. WB101]AVY99388.1 hypothetical protein DAI21_17885 [Lelliottia sp. WB101]
MKTTTALYLGDRLSAVSDYRLVLELSGCGRGLITAECDRDCTGELVRLDLGMGDTVYRWFTGFVERCGPADNGFKRLYVREFVGALRMRCPISLQHPTLRDVCDTLQSITGLVIHTPDNEYTRTKIPHFKCNGTGYLAVERLGAAFSVPDFCWYQLPDGTVYIGGYAHSRFAGSPVDVPESFASRGDAGNSLQMGLVPAIRPGVIVNGRRITRVEASNSDMQLSWTPLNSEGKPAFDPPEKRQIDKHYPELSARLHVPRLARVTGAPDVATLGDISDPFRPRYAVNLQLLDESGNDDASAPEMVSVPLPVPMAAGEGGMFSFPGEGVVVEVGFVDGQPDKPVVRQTLQDGQSLPAIQPGEQLQQQRAGVSQRVTREGSWQRETDQAIEERSASRVVVSDSETRETTQRQTTVKANDTTMVIGTITLMAGKVMQIADGDFAIGAAGELSVKCQALTEQVEGLRKSTAAMQMLLAPGIIIGSEEVNVLSLMTDTLDVLRQAIALMAVHSHSNNGSSVPNNAGSMTALGNGIPALNDKYSPFIK